MLTQFPVIVGPTAGGKSALALALGQAIESLTGATGEIVSADSMQIYRGMDIGTAKPTRHERDTRPHHLIDLVEPLEAFSVDEWLERANRAIDEIRARRCVPIVVGGTHLYVQALLYGLFDGPPADEALRAELSQSSIEELRAELERIDPQSAARLHPNDRRRTIRAIEVSRATGQPLSALQREWEGRAPRSDARLVGLEWPVDAINRRINARVRRMVEEGLVDEARALWETDRLGPQAREALGYKQLIAHFEGRVPCDEAIERIKIETRRFAKNQRTWLRRLRATPGATWLEGPDLFGEDGSQIDDSEALRTLSAALEIA